MDPALWAELEGPADEVIAALIRRVPGRPPPRGARVIVQIGEIATVRVPRGELLALRHDPAVASLKAPRTVVPERPADDPPRRRRRTRRSLGPDAPTGRGVVVGVVDWGCDVTHPNLMSEPGRTRLLALWDQRATHRRPPEPYGYGVVHSARRIDRALASDDPFGTLRYDPLDADEDGQGSHGTHVLDIAAGVPRVGPGGVAPGADLVFVHLASPAWEPRRIGSSVCLLEAIDFIGRVAGDRPCVINLSMGSQSGPHDGSTLCEQAFDAFVTRAPGRAIVQSCGNYRKRPAHATGRLARGERRVLDWLIDPTDTTPNELEVWYAGSDAFAISLISPDGTTVARAAPDSHGPVVVGGCDVGRFAHRCHDPNNCDNQALLVVDPVRGGRGRWQVVIEALTAARGTYDVWIERDEGTPGSQSRLARRDAVPTTTTGTICNGHHTISVGAYDPATRSAAWFSSAGPTRDGRAKPDLLAPGVGIVAARSASDDDDDDDLLTTKSGTSMASPHVAGAVAVLYEAADRPLGADEVRRILVETARRLPGGGPGLLDLRAAVRRVTEAEVLREDVPPAPKPPSGPCDDPAQPCGKADEPPPPPPPTPDQWLAQDTPRPADDLVLDKALRHDKVIAENERWWTQLGLDRVKPLRGLDPATHPLAYANRTLALQRFLVTQALDVRVLGRKIEADGILGPEALTIVHAIAVRGDLALFRTDLVALGVATERVGAIGATADAKARVIALPLEVLAEWNLASTADKVIDFYDHRHIDTDVYRTTLQNWLLAGVEPTRWPAFDWPPYLDLMRRLYGTAKLHGRGSIQQGRRRVEDSDIKAIAARDPKRGPQWIWWRDPTAKEQTAAGITLPATGGGKRAVDTWAASTGDPEVDMAVLFYFPKLADDTRTAVITDWLGGIEAAAQQRAQHNRESLKAMAERASRRLDETRNFVWEHDFAQEINVELVGYPPDIRTTFLDELKTASAFDAFFAAFGDMVNFDNRAVAVHVVEKTSYETDPAYVKYLAAHKKKTEEIRSHRYDLAKREIYLDKKSDRILRVVGVAGDVYPIYKRGQKIDRLKPERQKALCRQTLVEVQKAITTAASAADAAELDPKKLLEDAINAAKDSMSPPLGKDDVETIAWEMSVRVTDMRAAPEDGIDRVQIEYEIVERINGGAWTAVPCSKRWRSEREFGEELFFIFWDHVTRVIEWIAIITIAVAAIAFLAISGLGVALVRLAGGIRVLLINIALSEAIYVLTSGGELTWTGFFEAALAGYLQAVGFRGFGAAGKWVGEAILGKATGLTFRRAAAAWLVSKGITGGGAFAFTEVAMMFTNDMIGIVAGTGGLSSWRDYLKAAGHGFVLGAVMDIGLGTVITGLGGALRGTVVQKLAQQMSRAFDAAGTLLEDLKTPGALADKMIAAHIAFDDFLFGATQGLGRFAAWLRSIIENPEIAANGIRAATEHVGAIKDAFVDALKKSPGAAKAAGGRALENIAVGFHADILALSDIALGDDAIAGLRRLITERGKLTANDLSSAMQQIRQTPDAANGLLAVLGALDKEVLATLTKPEALGGFLKSPGLATLIARGAKITVGDIRALFQRGFGGKIADLDAWVADLGTFAADVQDTVLAAMREHVDWVSPKSALALLRQHIALDATTLEGAEGIARASTRDALDALIAKAPPGLGDVLARAGKAPADAPALAALARNPELAAGLIDSTATASELAALLEAAGRDAKYLEEMLATITPRPSRATLVLEDGELSGLRRVLELGRGNQQAAKRLLATPERARAFLRLAARATDDAAVLAALRRGRFEPPYTAKPMDAGFDQFDQRHHVEYDDPAQRAARRLAVHGGKLYWPDGRPFDTSGMSTIANPHPSGIYVMDPYGDMYASEQAFGRRHHSSFLAGKEVGAAGEIRATDGQLTYIDRNSGHYGPGPSFRDQVVTELGLRGIDSTTYEIKDY